MTRPLFEALRVSEHVYWVGAIDWALREFHGYATERGSTYNAYLILADKVTLVDTVKASFKDEMLARIASVIDPGKIDYIISNHAEMDHSGALPDVVAQVKPEKVIASTLGVKALYDHFRMDFPVDAVKDGDRLSLGNLNVSFVETRMLHWPESMFTYLQEDAVLFSQDAFGMHLASGERFADQVDPALLEAEAAKYYANILMPYASLVKKLISKHADLLGSTKVIAPDHGPIWRKDTDRMIDLYRKWSQREPTRKAVLVYATMWESTALMARLIAEGLISKGIEVKVMTLSGDDRSNIVAELLDAGALIVGSPTINNTMFPTVADFLYYLKGLKPTNLICSSFGSSGWAGAAIKQIKALFDEMKLEFVGEPVKARFVPDDSILSQCRALGEMIAEELNVRIKVE